MRRAIDLFYLFPLRVMVSSGENEETALHHRAPFRFSRYLPLA
jgi:hypothetical protein